MLGLISVSPDPTLIQLGPFAIGWYGIGYVVALAALVVVTQREVARRGIDPKHVLNCFLLVAVLALIGARLYHVIDEFNACGLGQPCYRENPLSIVMPPYSGLGLYGGIAGALLGIVLYTRRFEIDLRRAIDAVVPGTLLAQGIARWGNFFNQELYGPPTDAAWGITIDCDRRVPLYPCPADAPAGVVSYPYETTGFHPLFFYESTLNIVGAGVALLISRRLSGWARPGDLASFWLIWYGSVRSLLELFREGYNWTISGVPTAMLIGLTAVTVGVLLMIRRHRGPREVDPPPYTDPPPGEDDDADSDDESDGWVQPEETRLADEPDPDELDADEEDEDEGGDDAPADDADLGGERSDDESDAVPSDRPRTP